MQHEELRRLVGLLANGNCIKLGAIPWASPVLMFGSLLRSRVATLGLNPSNLEFEDARGDQLEAPLNRFETLDTLRLRNWARVEEDHLDRMWDACERYFMRRPYDGWFRRLDKVLGDLGVSYYSKQTTACHLDLVPFATSSKWSDLNAQARTQLITIGAPTLVQLVRGSDIRVLVLNGASVVRAFEALTAAELRRSEMPLWALRRGEGRSISGYGYVGRVSAIDGSSLGREVLVLGYNHNIQSSFGVTTAVVQQIRQWIAQQARGVLR